MLGFRYPSKKALREAIAAGKLVRFSSHVQDSSVVRPEYTGDDGNYPVVGPDAYNSRKWYATLEVKDNLVVRILE